MSCITGSPDVTIVTVTLNDKSGLIRTLESALSQSHRSFEIIVIDGSSSDGTPEYLASISAREVRYLSEPDKGVYDAMNKGIDRARGSLIIFLNAGDVFLSPHALRTLVSAADDENTIRFCRTRIIGATSTWIHPPPRIAQKTIANWLRRHFPIHQSMVVPTDFAVRNHYRTQYEISADGHFKAKAFAEFFHSGPARDLI